MSDNVFGETKGDTVKWSLLTSPCVKVQRCLVLTVGIL